ncbi:MAG: hypothetical protein ACI9S8_002234 [Chlamydiales bacterium]|jgi:hypothetical protein
MRISENTINEIKIQATSGLLGLTLAGSAFSAFKTAKFAVAFLQSIRFPCLLVSSLPLYSMIGAVTTTYVMAKVTLDLFEIRRRYRLRSEEVLPRESQIFNHSRR